MTQRTSLTRTLILQRLADGQFHSGELLGKELGLSRASVSKNVKALGKLGLDIFSVTGKGYRLAKPISLLSHGQIVDRLEKLNPEQVNVLNIIDSTNTYIKQQKRSLSNGYVCIAEAQTEGRGRRGRSWVSPYGASIYLSMFWSFPGGYQAISGLSLVVGIAIVQALKKLDVQGAMLKWPNDVYLHGKKLAGILVEVEGQMGSACEAVIGLGLNIDLPESKVNIDQAWTDLSKSTGWQFDRNELAANIIDELVTVLTLFEKQGLQPFLDSWKQHDYYDNQPVTLHMGEKQVKGTVRGVNQDGALMLEQNNRVTPYHGGEISVRPG
ncbi:bifunctional biotin--[acetyl-CoA-carboxylase] ligase/biotin operon repressor BirA [Aliiglaciecola litoralis]|uniref:Bifunctional ligase/repressor BirA n=1 Tax=Aliiglaciecola litoralis TaxID=582857 RepID=A0ABP3X3K1_9ALTE